MLIYVQNILAMLLIVTIIGYILITLKEKYYLWNNMVIIESKALSQRHIDEVETKHFRIGSTEVMAGDEMKIIFNNKRMLQGIILGAKIQNNSLLIITSADKIESVSMKDIKNIKIITRYGKLFKTF